MTLFYPFPSGVRSRGDPTLRRLKNGGLGMTTIVSGTVRGSSGTELEMSVDSAGNQFVALGALPYSELTRLGQGWQTMSTSAAAALVARPSTLAAVEIWNGYQDRSLEIDRLFAHELVTSTTGLGGGAGIWACVSAPVVAGPSITALTIIGNSGKTYNGLVRTGVGTTVVANGWFPWGAAVKKESAGAVVPGGQIVAEVNGRITVPPYASLLIHVVSGYAADTFTMGASWFEKMFPAPYSLN